MERNLYRYFAKYKYTFALADGPPMPFGSIAAAAAAVS
jgi:hypothetical protein